MAYKIEIEIEKSYRGTSVIDSIINELAKENVKVILGNKFPSIGIYTFIIESNCLKTAITVLDTFVSVIVNTVHKI